MRALLAALALCAPASAQAPSAALEQARLADLALAEGRYLEAVDRLRAVAFRPDGSPDPDAFQTWLQVHPTIGGLLDRAAINPEPPGPLNEEAARRMRAAQMRDALGEIRARAARTRIVVLNEAHNMPRDRAFALEVAKALRPLGYTILAAETFGNRPGEGGGPTAMERLSADGYARRSTGHYTMDPVFGDFVRQAMRIGYRPAAYEWIGHRPDLPAAEQIALREQAQAEALASILRREPQARLLVFVGYSHAIEAPFADGEGNRLEWMTSRLKRLTGVDPLTIDQTLFEETSRRSMAHHAVVAGRIRERPVVLFEGGQPLVQARPPGAHDLQVIHPPLRLRRGRPDWMWRMGRRAVEVPRSLLPRNGRRLIQAFVAGDAADAIPLDQIVVEAGRPAPPILVPRQTRIRWAFQDPVPLRQRAGC